MVNNVIIIRSNINRLLSMLSVDVIRKTGSNSSVEYYAFGVASEAYTLRSAVFRIDGLSTSLAPCSLSSLFLTCTKPTKRRTS